jgi:glycerophosphoryl diester phosphodiesterase
VKKVLVIGHRGALGHAPENTRASFEKAWRLGADAVECDVHLSRDGRLVVIHDETLDRTTNGRGLVRRRTWKELARLDAGRWFGARFKGERLWHLEDLLAWARRKKSRAGKPFQVIIEIKNKPVPCPGIAEAVVETLHRFGFEERCRVISFDHGAVRRVKTLDPRIPTGILFSRPPDDLEKRMRWTRADALFPRRHLVTPALVRRAHRRGWYVGTWTVDEPDEIKRVLRAGVDAVAGNFPERIGGRTRRITDTIALHRLLDKSDPIISGSEMRKRLDSPH